MSLGRERVVALADMDCFYIQVEQRLDPRLRGKPCAVVQYKTWKGGGIIAVSYEARTFGVTRNMWANDAKKLCPDLLLARVPEAHGKADLTKYREASMEVMEVMSRFAVIERASIDEAYMDLTSAVKERLKKMKRQPVEAEQLPTTYIQGLPDGLAGEENMDNKEELRKLGLHQWLETLPSEDPSSPELQLTIGAVIMEEMRVTVESVTGFRCSVGISHNKVLAKLACGLNKPNRQTLVSHASIAQLFNKMPISHIRNLGGKLGASVTELLGVEYVGQLIQFSESQLQAHFGEKNGSWLYDLCRGIDHEPVKPRQLPKSIGCSKHFLGKAALVTQNQVQHWLLQLALDLEERLNKDRDQNNRIAKQLYIGIRMQGDKQKSGISRCCALAHYDAHKISRDAFAVIQNCSTAGGQQAAWSPVTLLQLSATKFVEAHTASSVNLTAFLTSDSQCTQATSTCAVSQNIRSLGSPKKEASKKTVNAIQKLFQRVVEKKHAQARARSSLPEITNEKTVASALELAVCPGKGQLQISSQILKDALEQSTNNYNPNSMQKQLSIEQSISSSKTELLDTPLTSSDYTAPLEMEKPTFSLELPAQSKEEQMQSTTGLLQEGAGNWISPSCTDDWMLCEKCNQQVLAWEFAEHLDYHFAVELQNSLSRSSPLSPSVLVGSPPNKKGKGKCRTHATTGAKRPRQDSNRTLDSFFKRVPP
ncbi:DNA polymerase eta [Varanus komodoensis]|uniref:DNA polymerase eta n=1 Tax=Varanus komodoensis TaxID=61221 RepID=A0A8D2J1K6_VARKO|nr:DNA polymerase eta [Varanus komodoensis]KAF7253237.1 DNA polymerase eta [Varanus komodoensis]